jgi:nicotinamidase-related amidase
MDPALIVVDMQQGSFGPESFRYDAEGLIGRLNALAERVRRAGGLVIFVQHDGPEGDPHHPSESGHALLAELDVQPRDLVVHKTANDAFLNTALEAELEARGIGRVIITGCATDFCVDATIQSALARGYDVTAPADGHTTCDRPHLAAAKIIEHHNAIWADFIAPGGAALVCPCAEVVPG